MKGIELNNNIQNSLIQSNEQKNFLQTKIGQVINQGLNIGLKYVLPDLIEDQVINIKDAILENGFKEGIKKGIDSAIDLGKSALGIVTGNFENISQVENAVKAGGIIDTASVLIDSAVNKCIEKDKISITIGNIIKKGKSAILSNVSSGIEKEFESELDSINKLNKYSNNWKNYYQNNDFDGMEKEYKKIEQCIKEIVPIENTIKEIRKIENLHNLIKNNGKDFNITEEQKELAEIL